MNARGRGTRGGREDEARADDEGEEGMVTRKIWSVGTQSESKIAFLLNDLSYDLRRRFLFDDVARFSVTRSIQAREICDFLRRNKILEPSTSTICDGCACVGGNALLFDLYFAHTTCVEFDPLRAALLKSNLLSGNPASFVIVINEQFFSVFFLHVCV